MSLQDDAAELFEREMRERHFTVVISETSDGRVCEVESHPRAIVYFTRDAMGGLLVRYQFDDRPAITVDPPTTAADYGELADAVVTQIGGSTQP